MAKEHFVIVSAEQTSLGGFQAADSCLTIAQPGSVVMKAAAAVGTI